MPWRGRRVAWSGALVVAALLSACTPAPVACTDIGSPAGVSVTVDRDLVVDGLRLMLEVCQDECTGHAVELQPGSVSAGQTCTSDDPDGTCSASASPDGTLTGFVDVDTLIAGSVRVSGRLQTPTQTTRLGEVTVTASDTHPNGRNCPVGGPQASVRVTATGLR